MLIYARRRRNVQVADWLIQSVAYGTASLIGRLLFVLATLRFVQLETKMAEDESEQTSPGVLEEIFMSPLNLSLLCLCLFLLYKIFRGDKPVEMAEDEEPLPKLKKRDFTLEELKEYDGVKNPRILMAVSGKVFDVTRGKKFYGPGTNAE